jgi:hypothetical protein
VQIDFRSSERSSLGVEPLPDRRIVRQREAVAAGALTDAVEELRSGRLTPSPKPATL